MEARGLESSDYRSPSDRKITSGTQGDRKLLRVDGDLVSLNAATSLLEHTDLLSKKRVD